jgi:hypothetical protein
MQLVSAGVKAALLAARQRADPDRSSRPGLDRPIVRTYLQRPGIRLPFIKDPIVLLELSRPVS